MSTSETQLGEVKALLPDKFYGFIKPPGVGAGIFFHGSNCVAPFDELSVGQQVTYRLGADERSGRPQAFDITPIEVPNV